MVVSTVTGNQLGAKGPDVEIDGRSDQAMKQAR